ncbi:hypothetical protein PFICI_11395 [Pestalotiopsis fici W106-1]|uniref:VOC domain-containing protein n=1 Tax=Pestalotiopsis fici (strain W106-1 / CGMCC3.15140) TaxID=1229662 RepID=W3WXB0_PESFW|nr:uncharacterized protein PFICI_11395 [Pestalotiopsis fici W106-1]ETS77521.1 hypothetical protein PFICI_11395 [Pestalotiopsis fici W106-1]
MTSSSAEPKTATSSRPILGSLNEICIVTPHLYQTLDNLGRLGLGPFRVFDFNSETVPEQELRGKKGSDLFTLLVAFAESPDPREPVLEIIQPLTGQTSMQDYLDAHGNHEGVQHIAFDMDNLTMDERLGLMAARGVRPVMQGVWKGSKGVTRFCFFDTVEQGMATCFETIAPSEDWQEPECRWYPSPPTIAKAVDETLPKKSVLSAYAGGLEELLQ